MRSGPEPRRAGAVIRSVLAGVGRQADAVARHVAKMSYLLVQVSAQTLRGRVALGDFINQAYAMGVQSLPLVIVTAVLSGVVTSQQGGYQFTNASVPIYVIGSVVASSIILELGPVITAFVVIGRVGARITAELGTMRVSEQIDALESLGRDPVRVLAAPRILAGVLVMPILVGCANTVGLFAGMFAARFTLGLGGEAFLYGARMFWHKWDLLYSLLKAVTFGLAIPLISVHMGLLTHGGAEGVGRYTTLSVVVMITTILILDALFPPLLLN